MPELIGALFATRALEAFIRLVACGFETGAERLHYGLLFLPGRLRMTIKTDFFAVFGQDFLAMHDYACGSCQTGRLTQIRHELLGMPVVQKAVKLQ